jgi:endo-1,4-beta-xylanase
MTLVLAALTIAAANAQSTPQPATVAATKLPSLPAPLGIPKPNPATDAPYSPSPILPGGVVVTLYPPGSPYLKMERVREAEQYNMSSTVPGESAV